MSNYPGFSYTVRTCVNSHQHGQPQSHRVLCSWWGGGTNFESATWLIGQLLQGQGSFEGFLLNEGVIERENQKKKKNSKNSTNFCQFSSQNTILGSLFYDKINWKFWWHVKTGSYLVRDCWIMVLNYTKWGQWVTKSDQSSLSSIFSIVPNSLSKLKHSPPYVIGAC